MLTIHFPECYPEMSGNVSVNNYGPYHHHHHNAASHLDFSNLVAISPHSTGTTTAPSPLTDNSMDTVAGATSSGSSTSCKNDLYQVGAGGGRNASPQSDGSVPGGTQYYFDYNGAGTEFESTNTTNAASNSLILAEKTSGSMVEHSAIIAPGTVQQRVYPIVYGDTSMLDKSKLTDGRERAIVSSMFGQV